MIQNDPKSKTLANFTINHTKFFITTNKFYQDDRSYTHALGWTLQQSILGKTSPITLSYQISHNIMSVTYCDRYIIKVMSVVNACISKVVAPINKS